MRAAAMAVLLLLAAGCATTDTRVAQRIDALLPADVILLGEQHDARAHQELERAFVEHLSGRGLLAALVLEMADRGTSTAALGPGASEAQVRAALRWDNNGWPWAHYGPVVMAAAARGVPVLGANLPRTAMRQAMADARYDRHLGAPEMAQQRENIRLGHCDLLPQDRLTPMVRMQLARDASMAATVAGAVRPGKVVLLVAGGGHVVRALGVPTHLPAQLRARTVLAVAGAGAAAGDADADTVWATPELPPKDHCADMARQLKR